MIIKQTRECNEISVIADRNIDLRQSEDWIQIDKEQAAQLIEVLEKWINGEDID